MGSRDKIDRKLRGLRMAAIAPGILLALSASCHRAPRQESSSSDEDASSAVEAHADAEIPLASAVSLDDLVPPSPIVETDPDIPLNEAVVGTPPMEREYAADIPPPAPVLEQQPPSPARGQTWIPGYWWWSAPFHRYVWVSGAWRNPPPDQIWTTGSWVRSAPQRYTWRPGFWGPRGYVPSAVVEVAPPPPRVEVYGTPPGTGFVWTSGYYAYRNAAYIWTPGSWLRPPAEGFAWVEPRYVGFPGRYYFQPGRWDHPPEFRGTVYRPDIEARPGVAFRPIAVPSAVVVTQTTYVSASVRAVSLGATRTAGGGYTVHPGGSLPAGSHDDHASREDHGSHDDHGSDRSARDDRSPHSGSPGKRSDSKH